MLKFLKSITIFFMVMFIFFLLPTPSSAQCSELLFEVTSPSIFETLPGKIMTFACRVENRTEKELKLVKNLKLPDRIRKLILPDKFQLSAGKSTILLSSIDILSSTPPGSYPVTFMIQEKGNPEYGVTEKIDIEVLPKLELEITAGNVPSYISAGQNYEIDFSVRNMSNKELKVSFDYLSRPGFCVELSDESLFLIPGEMSLIRAVVTTDPEICSKTRHRLKIKAVGHTDDEKVVSSARSTTDIIPSMIGIDEPYNYIPLNVGLTFNPLKDLGMQFEISGTSILDEQKKSEINLFIRPSVLEVEGYDYTGKAEEYSFSYKDQKTSIKLGDQRFSLSSLTEQNVPGKGFKGIFAIEDYIFGTYYRQQINGKNALALSLDYDHSDALAFGAGYIERRDSAFKDYLLTLNTEFCLGLNHNFDFEYALGIGEKVSSAYSLEARGTYNKFDYLGNYTAAETDFPGRISDRESYSLKLDYALLSDLSLWGAYGKHKKNYDPYLEIKTNILRNMEVGASYYFDNKRIYLVGSEKLEEELYNLEYAEICKNSIQFGLEQRFDSLRLHSSYMRSWTNNNLTADILKISSSYRPKSNQRYWLSLELEKNDDITGSLNLNALYNLDDDASIDLGCRLNIESKGVINGSLSAGLKLPFEELGSFNIGCSYNISEDRKEDFSVNAYVELDRLFSLNVPVSRREIGSVQGRIYNAEDPHKAGLEGVIVRINELTAITDEDGKFGFAEICPGSYHLDVEERSLDSSMVVINKMPKSLNVEAGEDIFCELAVKSAAAVKGQAKIYNPVQNLGDDHDLIYKNNVPYKGLSGLLILLKNESGDMQLRYTDSEGYFHFSSLKPGDWKLTANNVGTIPEHYLIENCSFSFNLKPGYEKEVKIRIIPAAREMQIIDDRLLNSESDNNLSYP